MKIRTININPTVLHTVLGLVIGIFVLHPVTMVIYWFEFNQVEVTIISFFSVVWDRILHSFNEHMYSMSVAFGLLGGMVGLGSGVYNQKLKKKNKTIRERELLLQKGIVAIVNEGENERVELKSSLRYDYRTGNVNKILEHVILKSISGFLNNKGGLLIIGVNDDGEIIGLDNDYFSLKRKNRDGFEHKIIQLVVANLGGDLCPLLSFTFHTVADHEICSISIEKSSRPVYLKEGERTVFYLRSGNTTEPLTTKETVDYINSKRSHFQ